MTEIYQNTHSALSRPNAETLLTSTQKSQWQDCGAEGFWIKSLYEDTASSQRTWLMKIDPGASAPAHTHEETEQIFVIEGSFYDNKNTYRAGDFAIRAPGVSHTAGSDEGAVVLLVYS